MGLCTYCGQKAGFLSSAHSACVQKEQDGLKLLGEQISSAIKAGLNYEEFSGELQTTASEYHVRDSERRITLLDSANKIISDLVVGIPIPEEDFNKYRTILNNLNPNVNVDEMKQRQWFGLPRASMSFMLYGVLHGIMPYWDSTGYMQFNLQHGEEPLLSTTHVTLAEQVTVSSPRLWSGLSMPLGAGLYYHVGSSGRSQQTGLQPIDEGGMLLTTHAIYFGGQRMTLRIPYSSVLRYEPYLDGVGIFQSSGKPKVIIPDYSGMDTGWFFFNFLTALTKRLKP